MTADDCVDDDDDNDDDDDQSIIRNCCVHQEYCFQIKNVLGLLNEGQRD
jgi:hypothetical protein